MQLLKPDPIAVLDRHLDSVLERPNLHGNDFVVEMQILMLLTLRAEMLGIPNDEENTDLSKYIRFMHELFPAKPGGWMLTYYLRFKALDEGAELGSEVDPKLVADTMAAFVTQMRKEQGDGLA